MKLSTRETRYLKKLLKEHIHTTKFWNRLKAEHRLATNILNKIGVDEVLRDWDKE